MKNRQQTVLRQKMRDRIGIVAIAAIVVPTAAWLERNSHSGFVVLVCHPFQGEAERKTGGFQPRKL